MNLPQENHPEAGANAEYRALRNLLHSVAISVLILTGTLFVFLYRQVVLVRKNTAEMANFLRQYEESDVPDMIERVRQKLDAYRQSDPGFTPIYVKFFGTNPPARPLSKPATNNATGTRSTNSAR